ncbi:hypothetical protein ACGFZL_18555 [Streptomyces sp. NPDC048182]|uniref:hypothetical protein n=1 Tax=Streptomyces sp. NPDC048182 TaxID=3365507 RepID=UPI00371A354A
MPTEGPEVNLSALDWCAASLHEERVTQALTALERPGPTRVRHALHGLGYPDARIHGLRRIGTATRFFLDLRQNGGRLCAVGTAAGAETVVEGFAGPLSGPFTPYG